LGMPAFKIALLNTMCSGKTFTNICTSIICLAYCSEKLQRESGVLKY
jgi:hypothetical protein